jgi:hypothetical protein
MSASRLMVIVLAAWAPVTESKAAFGEKLALIAVVMVLFENLAAAQLRVGCEQGRVGG